MSKNQDYAKSNIPDTYLVTNQMVQASTLFQQIGQMHIDSYVQKLDIGYFNIQGLDVKSMVVHQSSMQGLIG